MNAEEKIQELEVKVAVLQTLQVGAEKNLIQQAKEYERRLELLNGEASRLRDIQTNYLPREVYESKHSELIKTVDDLRTYRDTMLGRQSIIIIVVSALISVGVAILSKFLFH